jgi:hypothetical protein
MIERRIDRMNCDSSLENYGKRQELPEYTPCIKKITGGDKT